MTIKALKESIKTSIQTNLPGTECYTRIPSVLSKFPAVVIRTGQGNNLINWPQTMVERTLYLDLLLQKGGLIEDTEDQLDTYLLPVGSGSMKAAIMATNTTGNADWIRVTGDSGPVAMSYGDVTMI
jgi:hypothetical protein